MPIKAFADSISDEYQKNFNAPIVMNEILKSDENDEFIERLIKSVLYCNSVMVFRKYIQNKTIKGNIVLIIVTTYCRSIMILPEKYWTENFIKNYWV